MIFKLIETLVFTSSKRSDKPRSTETGVPNLRTSEAVARVPSGDRQLFVLTRFKPRVLGVRLARLRIDYNHMPGSTPFRERMIKMHNHTAVAKAVVAALCALAVALSTIGMGVASAWAGSDQPSLLNFTPKSSKLFSQPVPAAQRMIAKFDQPCGGPSECDSDLCQWDPTNRRMACYCIEYNDPCSFNNQCCSKVCNLNPLSRHPTQKTCGK
jgi:hypothetical protein